ncbi:MAG: tetratricopeptide repeat protein [Bacteroidia bacterium]
MSKKFKRTVLVLCMLSFGFCLSAQDKFVDSLKLALSKATHDTTRCTILNALVENISDEKIWLPYNTQLLHLAEKNSEKEKDPPLKRFYLKHLSAAYNNIGYDAGQHGDSRKQFEYSLKSLKIAEQLNDKPAIATILNNLGYVYDLQGDIPKALEYYYKALKIQEDIKDKKGIARSFNNIGLIYDKQGDLERALEHYSKALQLRRETDDKEGTATTLNNIASIYLDKKDTLSAILSLEESYRIYEGMNSADGMALSLNNIGTIYQGVNNTEKALGYFRRALKLYSAIGYKDGESFTLFYIACVLIDQGKVKEAQEAASKSFDLAKELGYPLNIKNSANVLRKIYQKMNRPKEALEMYELEIEMRDKINNEQSKKESIRKQFQYQYEKKAAADSVRNTEEQKVKNAQLSAQKAQLKQERTQRFALYGGILLVAVFAAFVFNRFRLTQRQKLIIEAQKKTVDQAYEKLHEKNKEVLDSIRYARRIQAALLTPESYISRQIKRLREKK